MREADGLKHVSHYVEKALMSIMNMNTVDTTPGTGGAMAPPEEWAELSPASYRELIRDRYRNNPMYRQHMRVFARRLADTQITGPYADEARWILERI